LKHKKIEYELNESGQITTGKEKFEDTEQQEEDSLSEFIESVKGMTPRKKIELPDTAMDEEYLMSTSVKQAT